MRYDENNLSNMALHAQAEMDVLLRLHPDPDNGPIIEPFRKEIIALMNAFASSGHSGASMPYAVMAVSQAIKELGYFNPIAAITGDDSEWRDIADYYGPNDEMKQQNKRCGRIFKRADGVCTYGDAIRWVAGENGWSGGARLPDGLIVRSKAIIKQFPFVPKTFDIKVREEEVKKDDFVFHIDDPSVLNEVLEYYDLIIYNGEN